MNLEDGSIHMRLSNHLARGSRDLLAVCTQWCRDLVGQEHGARLNMEKLHQVQVTDRPCIRDILGLMYWQYLPLRAAVNKVCSSNLLTFTRDSSISVVKRIVNCTAVQIRTGRCMLEGQDVMIVYDHRSRSLID